MKVLPGLFVFWFFVSALGAQDPSSGTPALKSAGGIPKGYAVGDESISPNGRFAILYPIRAEENAELPPNLLVCLSPYAIVTRVGDDYGRSLGERGGPVAKWNGNSMVAIFTARKWGMTD